MLTVTPNVRKLMNEGLRYGVSQIHYAISYSSKQGHWVIAYCLTSIPQDFDVKILKSFKERLETSPLGRSILLTRFSIEPKILTTMVVLKYNIGRYTIQTLASADTNGPSNRHSFFVQSEAFNLPTSRLNLGFIGIVAISGYFMLKGWIN